MEELRVGLLGCGVVGGATLRILTRQQEELALRRRTTDTPEVTGDGWIQIVIEAMGAPPLDVVQESASKMRIEGTSGR